jgi:hypothetical protein
MSLIAHCRDCFKIFVKYLASPTLFGVRQIEKNYSSQMSASSSSTWIGAGVEDADLVNEAATATDSAGRGGCVVGRWKGFQLNKAGLGGAGVGAGFGAGVGAGVGAGAFLEANHLLVSASD